MVGLLHVAPGQQHLLQLLHVPAVVLGGGLVIHYWRWVVSPYDAIGCFLDLKADVVINCS